VWVEEFETWAKSQNNKTNTMGENVCTDIYNMCVCVKILVNGNNDNNNNKCGNNKDSDIDI